MANKTVNFTVTPGPGIRAYWIAVGDEDVRLVGGKGSIAVRSGKRHFLTWWFVGEPRSKLAILGKVGDKKVVEVKGSRIPDGEHEGAGAKRFSV